jgi:cell division protein FtsW
MAIKNEHVDRFFLGIVLTLVIVGIFAFISSSLGILAKNESKFYGVLFNQLVLGIGGGLVALIVGLKTNYRFWRNNAFYIFLGSIGLTLLVFVPGLGFAHGGARRWVELGPVSFQPVEFLKIAFVMYFAAWLSWVKHKMEDVRFGVLPLVILLGIIALVLFWQPDTKSFILVLVTGLAMLVMSGVRWKYFLGIGLIGVVVLGGLLATKPYLRERVKTFIDPTQDVTGSSYQLQQSLIAIGSGKVFGRGYGQSVQKFSYLPEPQGDSIFAVIGEEFGFVGTTTLVILFVLFALRGLWIAHRAPDQFSRLLVTGIVILLTAQSFLNIASIVGLFPLTGVPLVFISHGGTSLALALGAIGIVLHISRFQKKSFTK